MTNTAEFSGGTRTIQSDLAVVSEMLRGSWLFVSAFVVGFALLAATYLVIAGRSYESEAILLIEPQTGTADDRSSAQATPELVRSQLDVIQSQRVIEQVVAKLQLYRDPEFTPAAFRTPVNSAPNAAALNAVSDQVARPQHLIVENDGRSYVIHVRFRSRNSKKSALIVNTIAAEYIELERSQKAQAIEAARSGLLARLNELRMRAAAADQAAERFRQKAGLVLLSSMPDDSTSDAGFTAASREAVETATQKAEFDARVAQADAALATQQKSINEGQGESTREVLTSPLVAQLREQEAELERQEANLLIRYKPDHPLVAPVRAQLVRVRQSLHKEIQKVQDSVRSDAQAAHRSEQLLASDMENLNQKVSSDITAATQYRQLQLDAKIQRGLYQDFAAEIGRATERVSLQLPDVAVVSAGVPPIRPASPKAPIVIAAAALLGAPAGILASVIFALMRSALIGTSETQRIVGLPIIGTVAKGRRNGPGGRDVGQAAAWMTRLTARAMVAAEGKRPIFICIVRPESTPPSPYAAIWAQFLSGTSRSVLLVTDASSVDGYLRGSDNGVSWINTDELRLSTKGDATFVTLIDRLQDLSRNCEFVLVDTPADDSVIHAIAAIRQVHACVLQVQLKTTRKDEAREAAQHLRELLIEPDGLLVFGDETSSPRDHQTEPRGAKSSSVDGRGLSKELSA